jgi:hypothetical protein
VTDFEEQKNAMQRIFDALKKKQSWFNEKSKFYMGAATAMAPKLSGAGSEIVRVDT